MQRKMGIPSTRTANKGRELLQYQGGKVWQKWLELLMKGSS